MFFQNGAITSTASPAVRMGWSRRTPLDFTRKHTQFLMFFDEFLKLKLWQFFGRK